MNWRAEAVVLAAQAHGERNALLTLLAVGRGRWRGLYRPPARARGLGVEPGDRVTAAWSARQDDQLGRFTLEITDRPAARLLMDPDRLGALAAAAALCGAATADRAAADEVWSGLTALLDALDGHDWPGPYVALECAVLAELGAPPPVFVATPLDALRRTGVLFARVAASGTGTPALRAALAARGRLVERLERRRPQQGEGSP